jgi:hypothetical protein
MDHPPFGNPGVFAHINVPGESFYAVEMRRRFYGCPKQISNQRKYDLAASSYDFIAYLMSLGQAGRLYQRHCEAKIASHIHIYHDDTLVLQWYDAFWDPIVVSKEIPEAAVKRFCALLSLRYENMERV